MKTLLLWLFFIGAALVVFVILAMDASHPGGIK